MAASEKSFENVGQYLNPCHAESIKMPRNLIIFSQSDYLIPVVDTNSHTSTDPNDLDLHCLQRQGSPGSAIPGNVLVDWHKSIEQNDDCIKMHYP